MCRPATESAPPLVFGARDVVPVAALPPCSPVTRPRLACWARRGQNSRCLGRDGQGRAGGRSWACWPPPPDRPDAGPPLGVSGRPAGRGRLAPGRRHPSPVTRRTRTPLRPPSPKPKNPRHWRWTRCGSRGQERRTPAAAHSQAVPIRPGSRWQERTLAVARTCRGGHAGTASRHRAGAAQPRPRCGPRKTAAGWAARPAAQRR